MSFTQSNHTLQLTSRRSDPPIVASRVGSSIPHFDVSLHKFLRGGRSENWVNMVSSERDVGGEILDFLVNSRILSISLVFWK